MLIALHRQASEWKTNVLDFSPNLLGIQRINHNGGCFFLKSQFDLKPLKLCLEPLGVTRSLEKPHGQHNGTNVFLKSYLEKLFQAKRGKSIYLWRGFSKTKEAQRNLGMGLTITEPSTPSKIESLICQNILLSCLWLFLMVWFPPWPLKTIKSPISRWWYSELLTSQKMFLCFSIIKLLP